MKNVTFSPCSDLQSKKLIWTMYQDQKYLGFSSATLIAGKYAEKYADDVKVLTFS